MSTPGTETAADAPAAVAPDRRPPGILCPDCGVGLFIRRTKPRRDNSVSRKRKCGQCGRVVTTFEYPAGARAS